MKQIKFRSNVPNVSTNGKIKKPDKINLKSTKPVQQIKLSKGFKQFIHDLTEFNEWIKCNKQTSAKSFQTIKFYCSYDFTAALKEIGEAENVNKQKN